MDEKMQNKIFLRFYEACKEKGFDPSKSEADKQRMLLFAKQNSELMDIFGSEISEHYLDAYNAGKKQADAAKEAEKKVQNAEQRKFDKKAAAQEQKLSELRGRDKRLFFYEEAVSRATFLWEEAKKEYEYAKEKYDYWRSPIIDLGPVQTTSNWGTMGGIAAGITGSTAVGAAVAADAMNKNAADNLARRIRHEEEMRKREEERKKREEEWKDKKSKAFGRRAVLERRMSKMQEKYDNVKLHLTEERPIAELMDSLVFEDPRISFTSGSTLLLQLNVKAKADYKIAGDVPAVIDGSFAAEIYHGDQMVSCVYLNLPRKGLEEAVTLKGFGLNVNANTEYTVAIIPVALWLIEKDNESSVEPYPEVQIFSPVDEITNKSVGDDFNLNSEEPFLAINGHLCKGVTKVPDLGYFDSAYNREISAGSPISMHEISWQQRFEERQREAEEKRREAEEKRREEERLAEEKRQEEARKAEEERLEAERKAEEERKRKAKNKKIAMIVGAVAAVGIVAAVVMTQVVMPAMERKQAEQLMQEQYIQAEELLASGEYEQAVAAFEALANYKDALERIPEVYYAEAEQFLAEKQFEQAVAAFETAGNYKDAPERIPEVYYAEAEQFLAEKQFEQAVATFETAGNYKDAPERIHATYYTAAEKSLAEGQDSTAAILFSKAGDYQDARERSRTLWEKIAVRKTVAAGQFHTVGPKSDGTAVAVGYNNYCQCDVDDWTDIVAVAAGGYHTVGLKSDGTVAAVGNNKFGQCDVDDWTDIVAVAAGGNLTVGLKSDGTVITVGDNQRSRSDIDDWTDIVAVAAGSSHTVGLKSDGTVVAVGNNQEGQCDVDDWTDIVAVFAGWGNTIGLRSDGTVVAVGDNRDGRCNVDDWTDIVAVAAEDYHTIGLKSDGTAVAVGSNFNGQCNVDAWTDIVAVAAGQFNTVGLKSDGTVIAVGDNKYGQCDVSGWTNIKLPSHLPGNN